MKRIMLHIGLVVAAVLFGVQLRGQALVTGMVLEQDSIVPIVGADIVFSGVSWEGDTLLYQFFSDTTGYYEAEIEAGIYQVQAFADGYEPNSLSDSLWVESDSTILTGVNFMLYEILHPVCYVAARHFVSDLVRVSWSMHEPLLYEDFETGDFSKFGWDNTVSGFPWTIDSTHAYEGNFCMKSTCEGQDNGLSEIEVSVYVPLAGQVSFFSKVSSEASWDVGMFYLDGVKLMECSGSGTWEEHHFDVTEGEHLFRWSYRKDASTNEGDDCFYVDCIHFYQEGQKTARSFQYFDLYRSRSDEASVMLASHLTDTVFMDMSWGSLPWGQYRWGVSCYYEGNRNASDTIWSAFLDKDMTTTFELAATTNVGLMPVGALVEMVSTDGQGQSYSAVLDANGHVTLNTVYRNDYQLSVHLDGYEDYVSPEPLSIFAPTYLEIELEEKVVEVDSLYVSSTGWAIWQLYDAQNRDLQGFELRLGDVFVGTTTEQFFQFDEEMLEAGQHYTAQVRPIYLSDTCDWFSYEWTYRQCSDFPSSAQGLEWSLQDETIVLSWEYPENDSVMGAILFRDGVYLGYTETNSFWDSEALLHDDLEYCMRLVYNGIMEGSYYSMSCKECVVATFPAYCDPPTKLEAENYMESASDYGALISWGDRPEPIYHWLHYDNGEYANSVGGNGESMFWAIRFDVEDLAEYQGAALKKIALFDAGAGSYQLWVYVGGDEAPRTMVRFQEMTMGGTFSWQEKTISPALEIPENEPIWIVVGQQGLSRPAAASADMGDPNGRWASLDGTEWHDLNYYNLHYTWMLRAFVSNRSGKMQPLSSDGFVLQHYNLYRSYNNDEYQQIATIPAVEGQLFYQYRDELVDTPYNQFYYRLTAHYLSDEGEECESDFAASLHHPDENYVVIDDHWEVAEIQENALRIYPNPASGWLTVKAESIQKVTVFNTLGQCVMEIEVSSEFAQFDLSDWTNGLYLLRITTKNGVLNQRFVVSH